MKKSHSVRTIILAGSLLLQLGTLCFQSCGAAGDVDLSFDPGSGVNGTVSAVVVQPDGKVIIGGEFSTVKGLARSKVARLNPDGSGDSSFNAGTRIGGVAHAIALQSDGRVLVGDDLGITRLNSDGSQDTNFNASIGSICGEEGCYRSVNSMAVQSDGKVLIGGYFYTLNGTNYNYGIARLNSNGSLDSTFNPVTGANYCYSVVLQPDGKVLIGGTFIENGTNRNGVARFNANGSLDSSFNQGAGVFGYVISVALQSDGKVLFGGSFTAVNGTNCNSIARLNADGSLDSSFIPRLGPDWDYPVVRSIVVQSDGKVLIGGYFTSVNGTNRNGFARLNANGSPDASFSPGTGVTGSDYYPTVNSVVVQSDGKMFIGGLFTAVNGTNRNRIARLNADGGLDESFHPGRELEIPISSLVAQPDGKVLVGGPLTFINGTNRYGSARLNADGSLDSTFIPASFNPDLSVVFNGPPDYVTFTAVAVQSDGKVLVGGVSVHYDCNDEGCIVYDGYFVTRHNPNGSRDASFDPALGNRIYGGGETVQALAAQPDGKVVVGGNFHSIKGTNRNGIARLNANGSLDSSFNPGTGPSFYAYSIAPQSDGKLLLGLDYGIGRLNSNGSYDSSFNTGAGVDGAVRSIALQADGKVLIGGSFTNVNGTNRNHIARLNANGSLDSSFNPGTGGDGSVRSIALQADGNVLIGGDFLTVNGVVRPHVARLFGDAVVLPSVNIARSNAFVIVSWPSSATGFLLQQNTDLTGTNWTTPSEAVTDNGTTKSITVNPALGNRLFRLRLNQ